MYLKNANAIDLLKPHLTEDHRRRGPGTREKISLKRINLECNTYVQESNANKFPV
jgi:hypothetical protein